MLMILWKTERNITKKRVSGSLQKWFEKTVFTLRLSSRFQLHFGVSRNFQRSHLEERRFSVKRQKCFMASTQLSIDWIVIIGWNVTFTTTFCTKTSCTCYLRDCVEPHPVHERVWVTTELPIGGATFRPRNLSGFGFHSWTGSRPANRTSFGVNAEAGQQACVRKSTYRNAVIESALNASQTVPTRNTMPTKQEMKKKKKSKTKSGSFSRHLRSLPLFESF